jgi:hypothetical protein
MQLEQRSAIILSFRRERSAGVATSVARLGFNAEKLANFAFLAIVFALAALWLVFPPAQLSTSPAPDTKLAQDSTAGNTLR